jgi:hypothetical protein
MITPFFLMPNDLLVASYKNAPDKEWKDILFTEIKRRNLRIDKPYLKQIK